jgi:hypothetical protein
MSEDAITFSFWQEEKSTSTKIIRHNDASGTSLAEAQDLFCAPAARLKAVPFQDSSYK